MISLTVALTALTFFFMPAQTVLYTADARPIVTLPAGYFVMQSDQDAPNGYISVVYDDINGYVLQTSVQAVDYRPVTKYETTVKFKCDNDGQPVNLRAEPKRSAEILSVLDFNAVGHSYGTLDGDALIKDGGTLWYYVSVNGLRGYCYYAHVSVEDTPPNVIEKEPDPEPPEPSEETTAPPQTTRGMNTTTAIIFIVALCIPVPFIMFYLFRKPKDGK